MGQVYYTVILFPSCILTTFFGFRQNSMNIVHQLRAVFLELFFPRANLITKLFVMRSSTFSKSPVDTSTGRQNTTLHYKTKKSFSLLCCSHVYIYTLLLCNYYKHYLITKYYQLHISFFRLILFFLHTNYIFT